MTFYVDGNVCARNGEVIKSAANGTYTISVPIGKHFIQARMNGHVFLNNGRYPADPDNTGQPAFVCDGPTRGLDFFDQTLVNFTGRVVGGDIEGSKPTGFGQSVNNIGVAEFFLKPVSASPYMNVKDDGTYNNVEVPVASSSVNINSTSWRGAGDPDESRKLYIQTDPQTGEFSAMVPPLGL